MSAVTSRPAPSGKSWYFAYGSNLSVDQMVGRVGLTIDPAEPPRIARLAGYRLVFECVERGEAAYANVVRPGREVWGVVYRCSEAELARLDAFEQGYRRELLEVSDRDGEVLVAATYVMKTTTAGRRGRPSVDYLARIMAGAVRHGLPEDYCAEIAETARTSS